MTSPQNVVILLLGETGSGKSSFVEKAGGHPDALVGSGLEACTARVQAHKVTRKKRNILLVDTPGFNQTKHSDSLITKEINAYLDDLDSTVTHGAVLVFIPLNEPRMKKTDTPNAKVLSQLAKDCVATVIVTVGGNDVSGRAAADREAVLRGTFDDPQSLRRFDFTADSAESILDEVLEQGMAELQILKNAIQSAHGGSAPKNPSKKEHRLGSLLKWLMRR